jgi:hypothetical protein
MKNKNIRTLVLSLLTIPTLLIFANPSLAEKRDFIFHNKTGKVIKFIYISASTETVWGDDILGENTIDLNDSFTTDNEASGSSCLQDFKAVFNDDSESEIKEINVCETDEYTFL